MARTALKFLVEDGKYDFISSGSLLGINYKETEKIDETTTTGYGSGNTAYKETYVNAEQTRTNKISADDATDFVNSSQDIDAQHTDSKTIENDISNSRQSAI